MNSSPFRAGASARRSARGLRERIPLRGNQAGGGDVPTVPAARVVPAVSNPTEGPATASRTFWRFSKQPPGSPDPMLPSERGNQRSLLF